jgi:hypothetical protein
MTVSGAQAVARHMLEIRRLHDMEAYLKELGECLGVGGARFGVTGRHVAAERKV